MEVISVKHDSDSDSQIVLRTVEQSRRVVVDLNDANIDAIAGADIDTAAECTGESRVVFAEIRWTWDRGNRDTDVVADVDTIAKVRRTYERVDKRLERSFRRVIFDLDSAQKVVASSSQVDAVGEWAKRNFLGFEVSGKIKLQPNVSRDITRDRSVEAVRALRNVDDVVSAYAVTDPVVRIAREEVELLIIIRLRRGE